MATVCHHAFFEDGSYSSAAAALPLTLCTVGMLSMDASVGAVLDSPLQYVSPHYPAIPFDIRLYSMLHRLWEQSPVHFHPTLTLIFENCRRFQPGGPRSVFHQDLADDRT